MKLYDKLFGKKTDRPQPCIPPPAPQSLELPTTPPPLRKEGDRIWGNYRTYEITEEEEQYIESTLALLNLPTSYRTSSKDCLVFTLGGTDEINYKPYQIFVGKTVFEKDNPFDKTEVRLRLIDGLLIGYIIEEELDDYLIQTNKKDNLPFVAITYSQNGRKYGKCAILKDIHPYGNYSVQEVLLNQMRMMAGRMLWIEYNGIC